MVSIESKIKSVSIEKEGASAPSVIIEEKQLLSRGKLPLTGKTYKIKPGDKASLYVVINDLPNGKPFEIFIYSKDAQSRNWTDALTRVISSNFRHDSENYKHLVDDLKSTVDIDGYWSGGRYYHGVVAHLGYIIEEHLGYNIKKKEDAIGKVTKPKCPKCGEYELVKSSGCENCLSCDYSKCG